MQFVLTRKAKADMVVIAIYTQERWGKEQRNIYLKRLDDAFHLLAQNPHMGQVCDYIRSGYRKFPQASHIIFYRQLDSELIEIVRIIHKQMDVDTALQNP